MIAFGCSLWGMMTGLFSGCSTITQGYILWAVNGIGLALVVPTGQSLTADYYPEASRGLAFGALYLTGAFGAMLGGLYATNLGVAAKVISCDTLQSCRKAFMTRWYSREKKKLATTCALLPHEAGQGCLFVNNCFLTKCNSS